MPRGTLNSNGMNTGSNYQFGDKMIAPNFPRSRFDLSHEVSRDIPQAGLVFPVAILEVLPASDYTVSVDTLIRVLPQVVPLMSRQRVYTYAFYSRCSDLWDRFQTFMTKGYSGNEILFSPREARTPGLTDTQLASVATNPAFKAATDAKKYTVHTQSFGDFVGMPIGKSIPQTDLTAAMQEMMYMRIWRDYFLNRNYLATSSDKRLLPDDDSRFRLCGSSATEAGDCNIGSFSDEDDCLFYFDKYGLFSGSWSDSASEWVASKGMQYIDLSTAVKVNDTDYNKLFVGGVFYHDYPDDYFTSALPFAQRGDTSVDNGTALDMTQGLEFTGGTPSNLFKDVSPVNPVQGSVAFSTLLGVTSVTSGDVSVPNTLSVFPQVFWRGVTGVGWDGPDLSYNPLNTDLFKGYNTFANSEFNTWLSNALSSSSITSSSGNFLTLEKLRELAVNQTIQEKMARTDGSYAEFGLTFFGEKSKSAVDYRPLFVGGNTHSLVFTEVLQTSESTSDSPLGTYAGHGIGVDNDGFLGRFHSDDYGYLMILACIMPDVYYAQGLDRMWTRPLQSDWFLPERAQLGMRPILNREIYLQDSTVVDSDSVEVNTKLWAYQDIYDEYRYRPNRVGGQLANIDSESFAPFTQWRNFTSLPNWGQEFARADDIRTDYLSASQESPYIATFDINIQAVEPLNYRARPAPLVAM